MIKIDISRLSEDKEEIFSQEWDPEVYDLSAPGIVYKGPVRVEAFVKRSCGVVEARAIVRFCAEFRCSRCFKESNVEQEKTFKFIYSCDSPNKTISLDEHIREELILDYPGKFLCRPDCRGLCSSCGADLNEEKCKC